MTRDAKLFWIIRLPSILVRHLPRASVVPRCIARGSKSKIRAGHWTHVAVTYANGVAKFFINGVAAGDGPLAFNGVWAGDLFVGGTATDKYLNGYLDEVRIWSVARTAEQIQATMYSELRGNAGVVGLQAPFGDGGLPTLYFQFCRAMGSFTRR